MLTYDELLSLPFQLKFHQIFHSKTILILSNTVHPHLGNAFKSSELLNIEQNTQQNSFLTFFEQSLLKSKYIRI